mmetsp:Transcript_66359/g.98354  ORF Transcript_66359/g.98354 Transcript_66359/m.98354 type:complete len:108 (+) Transcript_66359:80-403(+)
MSSGIGFIGLGIMGEGMAACLLTEKVAGSSKDVPLVVWNRTKSKCGAFQEKYGTEYTIVMKDTAKEVVECCDITFSMLSTPEASAAVFNAPDEVLAGVPEKSLVTNY